MAERLLKAGDQVFGVPSLAAPVQQAQKRRDGRYGGAGKLARLPPDWPFSSHADAH